MSGFKVIPFLFLLGCSSDAPVTAPEPDRTPPRLELASADTTTRVDTFTVAGVAYDNVAVSALEYVLSSEAGAHIGSGVVPIDTAGTVHFSFRLTLAEQPHVISLRAFDASRNMAEDTLRITVDFSPPAFELLSAPSMSPSGSGPVFVGALDRLGVAWGGTVFEATYQMLAGPEMPGARPDQSWRSDFTFEVPLLDEDNHVTIRTYDRAGNFSVRSARVRRGDPITAIAAGNFHTCALDDQGVVWCWGDNSLGQLGTGDIVGSNVPRPVVGEYRFRAVTAATTHTCGITIPGEAYCWGALDYTLRPHEQTPTTSPKRVDSDEIFVTIAAGSNHDCALTTAGELFCWGWNAAGQLGDGSYQDAERPVRVAGEHTFTAVSLGNIHSCALEQNGTLYCWGDNYHGQLGMGESAVQVDHLVPTPIATDQHFSAVGLGPEHTCAVSLDGVGYCWGLGTFGILADGAGFGRYIVPHPLRIIGGLHLAMVDGGGEHTCGVAPDGGAFCWGSSNDTRMGTVFSRRYEGPVFFESTPIRSLRGIEFSSVSLGSAHTCGITPAGAVYCWGQNAFGQLGIGP